MTASAAGDLGGKNLLVVNTGNRKKRFTLRRLREGKGGLMGFRG